MNDLSRAEIRRLLSEQTEPRLENPYPAGFFEQPLREAAVLLPLTWFEGGWKLLFIRRSENDHDLHGGQVAFPGGARDRADIDLRATALREAAEEIGLREADVELLGSLREFVAISNYRVTPWVAAFPWPYQFSPDPAEVAHIFTIPLDWLADPGHREIKYRQASDKAAWPVIYFSPYEGEVLWGFTARLTVEFLEVLGGSA